MLDLSVPPFITISDVTQDDATEREYVLTNEATGKFFKLNQATVQFLDCLKRTGSVDASLDEVKVLPQLREGFLAPLLASGVLVEVGKTRQSSKPNTPMESKLISLRADLLDIAPLTRSLSWLGRLLYSPLGYMAWAMAVISALYQLIVEANKVALSLRNLLSIDWSNFLIFALIYVAVKIMHELGHALAYQRYCQRASLAPGPIRTGIAIFAMTPFPFTDVTGAWRLKSRWQRAMIGAGGLYFETWTIAILTLIWSQTQSGPVTNIILQVAVIAGLLTMFFNLNPAVKLDGYYVLTDLIRRPNLASRASVAARNLLVRVLGGQGQVDQFDLGYWFVSYLYRWTIFAGIFWLSYQFDPRLSPVVLAITLMMLVVRPVWATAKYAKTRGAKVWRASFAVVGICAITALLFVPLPDRLLLNGKFETMDTRYVEATETGILMQRGAGFELDSPDLQQQLKETILRTEMLSNTARAISRLWNRTRQSGRRHHRSARSCCSA